MRLGTIQRQALEHATASEPANARPGPPADPPGHQAAEGLLERRLKNPGPPSVGSDLIALERRRQQSEEGYTADHDRPIGADALAVAASVYAQPPRARVMGASSALPSQGRQGLSPTARAGGPGVIRIRRWRAEGWRMPAGARYVGRPSRWGNGYHVGDIDLGLGRLMTASDVVECYRAEVLGWNHDYRMRWLEPLRGATALACWCPLDQPCHADVLIELLEASA
jgi:hypothetical protein